MSGGSGIEQNSTWGEKGWLTVREEERGLGFRTNVDRGRGTVLERG